LFVLYVHAVNTSPAGATGGDPHQATIRDIEQERDVKLSNLQAVAVTFGLDLELVDVA
jgi:hypothetical protein